MKIIYFSATGNSKYIAKSLVDDEKNILYMVDLLKNDDILIEDDVIGIVSPVYFWGIPEITKEFLKKAKLKANYLFYVSTYGTTSGFSKTMVKELNDSFNAYFSIRMVDIWTPLFDVTSKKNIEKWNKNQEKELKEIKNRIKNKENGNFMKNAVPKVIGQVFYKSYKNARKTSNLHVESSCIGCGICAKKCPVNAIEIKDKKPVWVKKECLMCLGCLHRCPKFAIQYKNKTKKHGQYLNPNVKV